MAERLREVAEQLAGAGVDLLGEQCDVVRERGGALEHDFRPVHLAGQRECLHHPATVPHAVVLAPGLEIDAVYVDYWFWGRPSVYDLWSDLRELNWRIRADFDPPVPAVKEAWLAANR